MEFDWAWHRVGMKYRQFIAALRNKYPTAFLHWPFWSRIPKGRHHLPLFAMLILSMTHTHMKVGFQLVIAEHCADDALELPFGSIWLLTFQPEVQIKTCPETKEASQSKARGDAESCTAASGPSCLDQLLVKPAAMHQPDSWQCLAGEGVIHAHLGQLPVTCLPWALPRPSSLWVKT